MQEIIVDSEFFDAEATLTCGQLFRYCKTGDWYRVISLGHRCFLRTVGDKTTIRAENIDYFRRYFDLDRDYGAITRTLMTYDELRDKVKLGKGIRILNQDIGETIIDFIISANNNIPRIQGIIERLCTRYGEWMGDYYAFPTIERLAQLEIDDFRNAGTGFRDRFLADTARRLYETDFIDRLRASDYSTARTMLLSLKGVGPKVADCIMLFGLHATASYPVDTWVFKANSDDVLNSVEKVREYFAARYGELAGYAQQYVFYSERNKELTAKP